MCKSHSYPRFFEMLALLCTLILLSSSVLVESSNPVALSNVVYGITYNNGEYGVAEAALRPDDHFVALGSLNDSTSSVGFSQLVVNTSSLFSDQEQAYAAGYVEGYVTVNQTLQLLKNTDAWTFYKMAKDLKPFYDYFTEWLDYVDSMIAAHAAEDPYWMHVCLVMNQTSGLLEGYNDSVDKNSKIDIYLLIMINGIVEVPDVISAVEYNATHGLLRSNQKSDTLHDTIKAMREHVWLQQQPSKTRCSGLVKMTSDDVFLSHCTWSGYLSLFRIMKHFRFAFAPGYPVPGQSVSFSSYPLTIYSADDFYITSAGLAVFETTNSVFNNSLYQFVKPTDSVMVWLRAVVANRAEKTASGWTSAFAKYNSGTVNNQWVALDYKLVQSNSNGLSLLPDAISVLEQIPALIHTEDQTDLVNNQSYWSSFNVPYYEDIWTLSGYGTLYDQTQDPEYTWDNCARHNIFKRDQANVTDLYSMQQLMRSNDYENDPLSSGNPTYVISSRYDLLSEEQGGAGAFGATDCKIASYKSYKDLSYHVVLGPTHAPQSAVPVFQWSTAPKKVSITPHAGQPDKWDFSWQFMKHFP